MGITLTDRAAERLTELLAGQQAGAGLRLGVTTSGCSGFAYTMDFADAASDADMVFEDHGIKLFVDREHLGHLDGIWRSTSSATASTAASSSTTPTSPRPAAAVRASPSDGTPHGRCLAHRAALN
jgi:iron-sulfur cluster assembly protein